MKCISDLSECDSWWWLDSDPRVLTGFEPRGENPVGNLGFDMWIFRLSWEIPHRNSQANRRELMLDSFRFGFPIVLNGSRSGWGNRRELLLIRVLAHLWYQANRWELMFDSQLHLTDILQSKEEIQISFPTLSHSRSCCGDPDLSPFICYLYPSFIITCLYLSVS